MASLNDPFEPVAGSPTFVQRLPVPDRALLAFLSSVSIVAVANLAVTIGLHAAGTVGRGLYAGMLLLGTALAMSVLAMSLPSASSLRRWLVGFAALVAFGALASALSLAQLLALAFVRTAYGDPMAGDAEKLSAVLAAAFILAAALGVLSAVACKVSALPLRLGLITLFLAALAASLLTQPPLPLALFFAALGTGASVYVALKPKAS